MNSNNYRNYRRRLEIKNKHPELIKVLHKMCSEIAKVYGCYLDKIVLYGSYAREEETEESDVDIALFVKEGSTESMHDQMIS